MMRTSKSRFSTVSIVLVFAFVAASATMFFSARTSSADPAGVAQASLPKLSETSTVQRVSISGIVVPHHDIVRERRAALFETIRDRFFGDTAPNAIILIAPNHFNAGSGLIQTADREWDTAYGTIKPASAVIRSLLDARIASDEPASFEREHGILLVLKDIKKNFPSSPLVPLIVKDNVQSDTIQQLASSLNDSCASCLVVASVDFSHYQPAALADLHDRLSIRALQNRDMAALSNKAEVDSGPSLAFLARWAKLHGTQRFSLFDHTNSGTIVSDPDQESTSHVFGWYESGEAVTPEQSVTFAFAGDMMYGRAVGYHYEKKGFKKLFEQFGNRVFWGVDAAVANLEGPISDGKVTYDPALRSLSFNFPKQSRDALAYLRLTGVSLANNHTLNQGTKGLDTTRKLLKKKQIAPIGDPSRVGKNDIAYFKGEELRLAVVGAHAFANMSGTAGVIRALKKDQHTRVIVFPHWGIEYALKHSQQQEQLARAWIDAGADAVIGAHPHVIQDIGVYKGKPIVYSLGNFIFDQNFSTNTQQGLIVAGEFTANGLSLVLLPHESVRYQPRILTGKTKKTILKRITQGLEKYRVSPETAALLFFPSK